MSWKSREQGSLPSFYNKAPAAQNTNQFRLPPRKNVITPNKVESPPQLEQVKEDSRADKAGLKLGDSIVAINGQDTTNMTLQEANTVLEQTSQQDVKLGITKLVFLVERRKKKSFKINWIRKKNIRKKIENVFTVDK